jgi:hypothetical protein|tara:strand:+ start:42 stop:644 length:603 start_codon:yes stop_codon:yes gene_type:complete
MNLESDIEDLLNECHLTVRVNGILKLYEGIKQIKDLISEDGSFRDNPSRIPGIGKKRVEEIYSIRDWFVENYLTPQKENQSMNKYSVTFRAAVELIVEAKDSNSAEDAAWDEFENLNRLDDSYDHYTLNVEQITPSYYITVREDHHVEYDIKADSEDEARNLIKMGKQTPIDRTIINRGIIELEEHGKLTYDSRKEEREA